MLPFPSGMVSMLDACACGKEGMIVTLNTRQRILIFGTRGFPFPRILRYDSPPAAFSFQPLPMRACVTHHGQLATATRRRSGQCTCMAVALALLTAAGTASADCIDGAAHRFGTNPDVLRAIAIVESRAKPHAVRNNLNGSTDRGLFQINSIHLAELSRAGFVPADLHDVCLSSNAAALLLARKMLRFGNTWSAVGAYHSTSAAKRDVYAAKVQKVFEGIRRMRVAEGIREE